MIALTPRLQAVADYVPANSRFADIGTDHAYLPVWLIQHDVIATALAADLRRGPLDRARSTAAQYGLTNRIRFHLADGLSSIPPNAADCVAIAGMGGEVIRSILAAAPWTREDTRLILQPQSQLGELRLWLTGNGYRIREERCICEGERWYTVWLVQGGEDETVWTAGKRLAGNPARWAKGDDRRGYLRHLMGKLDRQLEGLNRAAEPDEGRLAELREARRELTELLEGKENKCQP